MRLHIQYIRQWAIISMYTSCTYFVRLLSTVLVTIDIDECATDTDNCHTEATCFNTDGSFDCICNAPAFMGNGTFCEGNDIQC